jgi:hypothetical protein
VFGSVKTAVGGDAPDAIAGSQRAFRASVPLRRISSPTISDRVPSEPTPITARDNSSHTMLIAVLPSPSPPCSSGRHPKVANPGEFFDDRQRDQLVTAMPLLRMWRDLPLGEAAHLM